MKTIKLSFTFLVFTLFTLSNSYAKNFETVYGRKADVTMLERMIRLNDLGQIVASMQKTGVRIFRVLETEDNKLIDQAEKMKKTKYFDFLPTIPNDLEEKLKYYTSDAQDEAAIFISWNVIGSEKEGNIILISEYVSPTTLFHEFAHHLFEIDNRIDTLQISADQNKYNSEHGVLNKRMAKVLYDRSLLVNRLWRRDIDNAIADTQVLAVVVEGRLISEEIAVESGLLKLMWESQSPWFDYKRAHLGIHGYGQGLVNMSRGTMNNVLALMDVVRTDGENMDPTVTEDEIKTRKILYEPLQKKMENYLMIDIGLMQKAVDEAKSYLESVSAHLLSQN